MNKRIQVLLIFLLLSVGCSTVITDANGDPSISVIPTSIPTPTVTPLPLKFDGQQAMEHVIAQMEFGPRPTGSEASKQTGDYIISQLEQYNWQTTTQPFEYQGVSARNIIGKKGQQDAPVFIIGAHYDTRMFASNDVGTPDLPVPGANDGASGVAVLLELARVLDVTQVEGQVWLVFFDAEDNGRIEEWDWIVGSTYFVDSLVIKPEYVIIIDMIGDAQQNIYLEGNSDHDLSQALWQIAAENGYEKYFIPEIRHYILDDHRPFLDAGIPAVDIIDFDYLYWHTTQDTIDKLSPDSLERVGRILQIFLEQGGTY